MTLARLNWPVLGALIVLSLAPRSIPALSSPVGPLGLGAAVLGAGGAGVATAEGPDALAWNAAALASDGWALAYNVGAGGVADALHNALGVTGELDEVGHVGLLVEDQRFGGIFREDRLAAGLAVSAGPWLGLGTMQRLIQAEPGGLRGWSMDLGASAKVPLGSSWALRLGAAGTDLASSLAWGSGLEEAQPSVYRFGAAVEMSPGTWLALQRDHLDRQSGNSSEQWRLGLQSAWFRQRLFLRAGATQADASALYATVGVGGRLPLQGQALELDYALMLPSSDAGGASLRHLVSLRWNFGIPAPAPEAGLGAVLKDKAGRVSRARIVLAKAATLDTKEWQLDLKDKQGRVIKVFHGRGPLPPAVSWNGKTDDGSLAGVDGISYDLRVTDVRGKTLQRHALLGPAPAVEEGVGAEMAGVAAGDYGLRANTAPGPRLKVHPSLKGQGLVVSGADFDLGPVQDPGAHGWELRIVDAEGKTVKRYSGQGRPPKSLRWSGTDDLGQTVDTGLGAGYVLRVTGADGRVRHLADKLVAPAYASAQRGTSSRTAVAACVSDPLTGDLVCTLHFAQGVSELSRSDQRALERALGGLRGIPFHEVRIEGHADGAGEKDMKFELSQQRADAVMKNLLEMDGRHWTGLVAVGLGDAHPLAGNEQEEGSARNRRVEIRFKEGR